MRLDPDRLGGDQRADGNVAAVRPHNVSGSFLGITLAAVVLGGARPRSSACSRSGSAGSAGESAADLFRNNLVTFAWFPLLSGLFFHWLSARGVDLKQSPSTRGPGYYLLVFATFMVALALNFAMVAGYECLIEPHLDPKKAG